ncbi:MAG TPA: fatty acyl-AMP ligase, partial [Candidatus Angelobacter sp.]|nr:fatty acyl-AMP ligase [Candidatus Angelobacter sp.]
MRSEYSDLADLLLARAASSSAQTVFTFLGDEEKGEVNWTYAELEQRARVIAAELQAQDCFGQRVILLYPSGLEFIAAFWGCLLAGAIAVPAYPPRSNRNLFRLAAIARDCQALAALTTRQILERMGAYSADASLFKAIRLIPTDGLPLHAAEAWKRPNLSGNSIALLQYTSGSTDVPKGVIVSHANLLHNEALIQGAFRQSSESVIVGWLPLYHDMGLIGNVLQPIYCGARCIMMSPVSFLQSPVRWLNAISRYRATTSGGPNFAYDLCTRKVHLSEEEKLDLSSWTVAFNGAEPVRSETMRRFARRFANAGFRPEAFAPCYGLAEATLLVSGHVGEPVRTLKVDSKALAAHDVRRRLKKSKAAHVLTSSGRVAPGVKVRIVNPESGIGCSERQVGEVWLEGPSVAQGYWGRPEESELVFGARIIRSSQGPFLRTGDLGFLQDGELFVTGRLKDMIIIRGRNLYPQDIEASVERAHPGLRAGCGAAFSVEAEGEEKVVIVQEVERGQENNTATMVDSIRNAVAEQHEIQLFAIFLTRAGSIPKTSSGKIQRYACRNLYHSGKLAPLLEWH